MVHNHVRPTTRRLGSRGFRAWLAEPNERLVVCVCDWAPELGEHYRNKGGSTLIENYVPADQGWGIVIGRLAQPPAKTPSPGKSKEPVTPEEDPQAS